MPILGPDEEQVIVHGARRGDSSAARRLYERLSPYIRGICGRYVADDDAVNDLVQNTFIKAFSSFSKFSWRGVGSLQAWLKQIAVRESIDFLRTKERSPEVPLDDNVEIPEEEEAHINDIPQEELFAMVKRLPDRYRTVFNMYVFEDMSHKEIGKVLGIGERTSASDLLRARRLLSKMMAEYLTGTRKTLAKQSDGR